MIIQKRSLRVMVLACMLMSGVNVCSWAQEPRGFQFNKLSISPFVNLEYMYDSNVNYDKNEMDDSILRVNPGVDLSYRGNEWGLNANAWYAYDWYLDLNDLNADRYGERIDVYRESAKGWRLSLRQNYMKTSQDDSIVDGGRGLWRDREEFGFGGALAYEFSEKTTATLNASYSDLTYAEDQVQYGALYGWQEWSTGLEIARKLSEKSNVLLSGSYQEYTSDGAFGMDNNSSGYTLHVGVGSRATERIRYRLLTGATWFDYAGADQVAGWTYSVDASWVISKKLAATIAGSSYFQPSEQEANQAMQVYSLSAGLSYKPMRRLSTRLDLAFRREESQFNVGAGGAYTDDRYSVRARADYELQRYVTLYSGVELEKTMSDESLNEYDRYRLSLGMNFRY